MTMPGWLRRAGTLVAVLLLMIGTIGAISPGVAAAQDASADTPATGVVQLFAVDSPGGNAVAGVCWDVTDAAGGASAQCDFDGDGLTSFELTPGVATISRNGSAAGTIEVVAGEIAALELVIADVADVTAGDETADSGSADDQQTGDASGQDGEGEPESETDQFEGGTPEAEELASDGAVGLADHGSCDPQVESCPSLFLYVGPFNGAVIAGDEIYFYVEIWNDGPGIATNVVVELTLPDGFADWDLWVDDYALPGAECGLIGNTVTCTIAEIAQWEWLYFEVSAEATSEHCGGSFFATATLDADNLSADNLGDTSGEASVIVLCPSLVFTKTTSTPHVRTGDTVEFTITLTNTGDTIGYPWRISIYDELPQGVTDWDVNNNDCYLNNWEQLEYWLNCYIDDWEESPEFAAGETFTVTLTGTVVQEGCGVLVNTAYLELSAWRGDGFALAQMAPDDSLTLVPYSRSAAVAVGCPNLDIVKTATSDVISGTDQIGFEIQVTNTGYGDAEDVTVEDVLPAGADWAVDHEDCEITAGAMICDFGTLAPDDSVRVHLTGTLTEVACGSTITNIASVTASNLPDLTVEDEDGIPIYPVSEVWLADSHSTSEASVTVLCPALVIEKTAVAESIDAGDEIGFNITITNVGGGPAYEVVIVDELPAGIEWLDDSTYCEIAEGVLSCELEVLPAGETFSVLVSGATAEDACGPVTNVATVSAVNQSSGEIASSPAVVTVACDDAHGSVQLVKIVCKVDKPLPPLFTLVGADGWALSEKKEQGCWRGAGVAFAITGAGIDPIEITTDRAGELQVDLIPGHYTITERSTGASATVEVIDGATTYVKVTNYTIAKPKPEPDKKPEPVEKLPDTGAGTLSTSPAQMYLPPMALLLLFAGALKLNSGRRMRRG